MSMLSWIRKWFARSVTRTVRNNKRYARPLLEGLEDRVVPSSTTSAISTASLLLSDTAAGNVNSPASVSKDGRYLVYSDTAANLASGQVMNSKTASDVFLYDRSTGTTTLVSHASGSSSTTADGTSENAVISADGKWIAYVSNSDNLVSGETLANDQYNLDIGGYSGGTFTLTYGTQTTSGIAYNATASTVQTALVGIVGTGNVSVTGGSGAPFDISFTGTLANGAAQALTASGSGLTGGGGLGGSFVLLGGQNEFLCDQYSVYLYDVQTGTNTLVSHVASDQGTGYATAASDGANGILTGTQSSQSDLATQTTSVSISGDGRYVTYLSTGAHLVNGQQEASINPNFPPLLTPANVFVYDRTVDTNYLVSREDSSPTNSNSEPTTPGDGTAMVAVISQDGSTIAFDDWSTDLVSGQGINGSTGDSQGETPQFFVAKVASGSTWASATMALASHDTSHANYESITNTSGAFDYPAPVLTPDGHWMVYMTDNAVQQNILATNAGMGDNYYLYDTTSPNSTSNNTIITHDYTDGSSEASNAGTYLSLTTTAPSAAISDDGKYVAFYSAATDLINGGTSSGFNAYVFSASTGAVTRVTQHSISTSKFPATTYPPLTPAISGDGRYIGYVGVASSDISGLTSVNTLPGSMGMDALLYDQGTNPGTSTPTYTLVSHSYSSTTTTGTGEAYAPIISEDGSTVLYLDDSNNLINPSPSTTGFSGKDVNAALPTDGTDLYAYSLTTPSGYTPQASNGTNATVTLRDSSLASYTGNGMSEISPVHAVSSDGRYTVFFSNAPNLVANEVDTNLTLNVYLYDANHTSGNGITLLSHAAGASATTGNAESTNAVISADGSTVVFYSFATNLISGETFTTGKTAELYMYNVSSGTLSLVSHTSASTTTGANASSPVSPSGVSTLLYANASGQGLALPSVSDNGAYIAYLSNATNLSGSNTGAATLNAFLYDVGADTNTMISHATGVTTTGNGATDTVSISGDGTTVAFTSKAKNLLSSTITTSSDQLYVWSRRTDSTTGLSAGQTVLASHAASGTSTAASFGTGTGSSLWGPLPASLSDNGAFVAYYFGGNNLVSSQAGTAAATNVFRYDVSNNVNALVSHTNSSSTTAGDNPTNSNRYEASGPSISASGRYIAFANNSTNLLASSLTGQNGKDNVYLYDASTQTNVLVSHASGSATTPDANGGTSPTINFDPGQTDDGRYVSFIDLALDTTSDVNCTFTATAVVRVFDSQATSTTQPTAIGNAFDPTTMILVGATLAPTGISANGTSVVWDGLASDVAASNIPTSSDLNSNLDVFQVTTTTSSGAPTLTSTSDTFIAGQTNTFQLTASGSTPVTFAFASGFTPPTWLTLTSGGVLSGNPPLGTTSLTFAIVVTNGVGSSPSTTFGLTINQAPALTSTSDTFIVGQSNTFQLTSSGTTPVTFAFASGFTPPTWLSLTSGGVLAGNPPLGTTSLTFSIIATNVVGSAPAATFSLTINQAPALTSTSDTFIVGQTNTFQLTASGTTPVTFAFTSGFTPPTWLSLTSGGVLSGNPPLGTSSLSFSIIATNVVGSAPAATFSLTVNQAPALTSTTGTFIVGQSNTFQLTASGTTPMTFAFASGFTPPSWLTLTSAGVLSGNPPLGTSSLSFSIIATNVVGSAPAATFGLTVNQAPALTSTSTTFIVGQTNTFQLTASGTTPVTFAFASGFTPPSWLSLTSAGVLSGNPPLGTSSLSFSIVATNVVSSAPATSFSLTVNQAPALTSTSTTFIVGQTNTFQLTASGTTPVTFAFASGFTPPSWLSLTSAGVLSGNPPLGTSSLSFSIVATNVVSSAPATSFSLTVNQAPALTSTSDTFIVGQANTFQLTASGTTPVTFAFASGFTPPSWLSLTSAGVLSGNPPLGTSSLSFSIVATNVVSSAPATSFSLTVNQAPALTSTSDTFIVGQTNTFQLTASGTTPVTFAFASGFTPPSWLSLTSAGVLSGNPPLGTSSLSFSIVATNVVSSAPATSFSLTVNQAPALTSTSTTFIVGQTNTFQLTASGTTPVTFAFASGFTPPSWLSLTSAGVLSGNPPLGTSSLSFSIVATNVVGSAPAATFGLTVNQAPAITSTTGTFIVGQTNTFQLTASGTTPVTFAFASGFTPPSWLSLTSAGVLSGNPPLGTSSLSFSIVATNVVGSAPAATFGLTVNQAPAITSTTGTFIVGQTNTFQLTASGTAPVTFAFASGFTPPSWLTLTSAGVLSGNPPLGTSSLSFSVIATNVVGSAPAATFGLTVNQAPAITSTSTTFTAGQTNSFQLTATGTTPITYSAGTGINAPPSWVTLSSAGVLGGTAPAGTVGTFTFGVTATNSVGSDPETFTLSVVSAPQITTLSTTFTAGQSSPYQLNSTGTTPITYSAGTGINAPPSWVTLTSAGVLGGTAPAGTVGTFTFGVTATNSVGSDPETFTLSVVSAPQITTLSTTFTAGQSSPYQLNSTGSTPITYSAGTGINAPPSWVTLTSAGVLGGTAPAGTVGTFTFGVTATNSVGSDTETFTLTVVSAPQITTLSTTFTTGQSNSYQLSATGSTPITYSAGTGINAPPSWITLSSAGIVGGTPPPGSTGTFTFGVTATNSVGSDPETFSLTVVASPVTPSGTVAASAGYDRPTFTWIPVAGTDHYYLAVVDNTTGATPITSNVSGTSFTSPAALTPGDSFTIYVYAINANGQYTVVTQTFSLAPLATPTGITPNSIVAASTGYEQPTFAWNSVAGADHYYLAVVDTTTGAVPITSTVSGSSYTATAAQALTPGHNYTTYVYALSTNSQGYSLATQTFSLAALATPTGITPNSLVAAASGYDQPTFSWSPVAGADHYYLVVVDNTTGAAPIVVPSVAGTSYTTTVAQALTPGHSFTTYVLAYSENNLSFTTGSQTFALAALPTPTGITPNGVVVAAAGFDQPTFSWNSVAGADHYYLSVIDTTTGATPITTNVSGTSYTVTAAQTLTPGDSYTTYVYALSTNNQGYSLATQTFSLAALATPTGLTPSGVVAAAPGYDHPTFTWNPVAGADHYYLTLVDNTTGAMPITTSVSGTSYTTTAAQALTPGHTYTTHLYAISANGKGFSVASQAFSLATLATTSITPNGLVAAADGYDQHPIAWAAIPGADHYYLTVVDTTTGAVPIVEPDVTGTSYTPTAAQALTPGDSYTVYLYAMSSNNQGFSLVTQTFTLAPLTPTGLTPNSVIAAAANYDRPNIAWNHVTGADHYYLAVVDTTTGALAISATVSATSYPVTAGQALTPGHSYTTYLYAISMNNMGYTLATQSFSLAALATPTGITPNSSVAGAAGYDQPTFSWNPVTGADHYYLVVVDNTAGTAPIVVPNVAGASYTSTAAQALTPGHSFTTYVVAYSTNNQGFSIASQTFSLAALATPTGITPNSAVAAAAGFDRPTFSWTPVAGADHYYLSVVDTTTGAVPITTNVSGTSYTATAAQTLTPGDNYTTYVYALSTNNMGYSLGTQTFSLAPLAMPTLTSPAGTITTSPSSFSWSAVAGVDHYYLVVVDDTTGATVINNPDVTTNSFSVGTPLTSGHQYSWWVAAISSNNLFELWSTAQIFTIS